MLLSLRCLLSVLWRCMHASSNSLKPLEFCVLLEREFMLCVLCFAFLPKAYLMALNRSASVTHVSFILLQLFDI